MTAAPASPLTLTCPRCATALSRGSGLAWCVGCGYEPPESTSGALARQALEEARERVAEVERRLEEARVAEEYLARRHDEETRLWLRQLRLRRLSAEWGARVARTAVEGRCLGGRGHYYDRDNRCADCGAEMEVRR